MASQEAGQDPARTPTVPSVLFGIRKANGIWAQAALPEQAQLGAQIKRSVVELILNVLKRRKQETADALGTMGATIVRAAEWVIQSTDWWVTQASPCPRSAPP